MSHDPTDRDPTGGPLIPRRTLFGLILAAGVIAPLVSAGTAHADTGTEDPPPAEEEYEIPDGIGSAQWW
jgi:hypothetical protein